MKRRYLINFIAFLGLFFLTLFIQSSKINAEDLTTLRIVGSPEGTFESWGATLNITNVKVTVRNVGYVEAKSITVQAELPNGQIERLSGPSNLKPNEKGVFSSSTYATVTNQNKIKALISCANCR